MVPEGWDLVEAQDICQRISVGIVVKPKDYYVPEGKGVKAFRSANVREGYIEDSNWTYISEVGHQKNKKSILQAGDVLIVRTGYPGTACVVSQYYAGANCIDIIFARPDQTRVLPEYLCDFTNSEYGKKQVLDGQGGLAQQHFNVGSYNKLRVPLPPLPEQRKIADILSTWDAAIEKTEALLATAKAQKRALMQSLLTGKRRFPQFEGQPWKEVRLGDVVSGIRGGGTPDKSKPAFWSGSVPWVSVKDLKARTIQTTIDSISEEGLQNSASNAFPAETVVVATRMAVGVTVKLGARMAINQDLKAVLPSKSILNDFLFYNLMMSEGKLSALGTGSTVKGITLADLRRLQIWLPASVAEQDRIISVLEDVDTEISYLVADLTKLRTEKKALMQQLLTGKRRVTVGDSNGI